MIRRTILAFLTASLFVGLFSFLSAQRSPGVHAESATSPGLLPGLLYHQTEVTGTQAVSGTQLTPVDVQPPSPVTVTVVVTVMAPPVATPAPTAQLPVVELLPDEVLTGTVVHNRGQADVFFFLDDLLYSLPANRATGLPLVRPLAGLTLFNCPADSIDEPACQWISYPIRRGAFYAIGPDPIADAPANLKLTLAVPPPVGAVWVQNRSGADGFLLWGEEVLELQNTGVLTLDVATDPETALYLPHCLQSTNQRICEWLPTPILGGVYYALVENRKSVAIGGVTLARSELQPLLVQTELMTPTPTPQPQPQGIFCQSQIPSLNVRSGPGTEFLVIGKLRTGEANGGRVLAVGRTESGEWLAVDPRFVEGGWIANVAQWLVCEGDTDDLPLLEALAAAPTRPTPVPTPIPAIEPTPTPSAEELPVGEIEPPQTPDRPGPKQILLIATNSFDHPILFTLDAAQHGLPEGSPSEYLLPVGDSIRFIIRAGRVQFSASTAWRDGSGNAEFEMAAGSSRELFLRFVPAENNPNRWVLEYE